MSKVSWRLASEEESNLVRESGAFSQTGFYRGDGQGEDLFRTSGTSTVRGDGGLSELLEGTLIKIVGDEDSVEGTVLAVSVSVRYGRGVESLKTGTRILVMD